MAKQKQDLPPEVPEEQPPAPAGEVRPPKFETPAPADGSGGVPRTVRPIERAPEGLRRFKVRALVAEAEYLYVLAKDEKSAREHYLKVQGLDRDTPLAVRQLPD